MKTYRVDKKITGRLRKLSSEPPVIVPHTSSEGLVVGITPTKMGFDVLVLTSDDPIDQSLVQPRRLWYITDKELLDTLESGS